MTRRDRIDAPGAAVLVGFSILMGFNQALVKIVNAGFSPALQAGLRSVIGLVAIAIFARLLGRGVVLPRRFLWPGLASGLFFTVEFLLLFQALDYTTVSRASVFFYTMPVWVAVGAHFIIPGDRMTRRKALGLALAVGGVALALGGGAAAGPDALFGDFLCLIGAMFWAGIVLVTRGTALAEAPPEMQLAFQLAMSAPLMIGFAYLIGDTIRAPAAAHYAILGFQGIVVVGIGFMAWFWVLSIYPPSDMASFGFLTPLFGVVFGWLIFDDPITLRLIAALALVGLGIALVNYRRRAGGKTPAKPAA